MLRIFVSDASFTISTLPLTVCVIYTKKKKQGNEEKAANARKERSISAYLDTRMRS